MSLITGVVISCSSAAVTAVLDRSAELIHGESDSVVLLNGVVREVSAFVGAVTR